MTMARLDLLELELQRSRRFGRPMTLVLFRPDGVPVDDVATTVAGCGRQVDQVLTVDDDVVVLLPEVGPSQAQAYVARVSGTLPALAAPPRTASFPNDGLTLSALTSILYDPGEPGMGTLRLDRPLADAVKVG